MLHADKANIAHKLNTHFINIGRKLADNLPPNNYDDSPNQYIKRSVFEIALPSAVSLSMKFTIYYWEETLTKLNHRCTSKDYKTSFKSYL